MQSFILWLSKEELDEITHLLITNEFNEDEVFSFQELSDYVSKIIKCNNTLIGVLKKMTPIEPLDVLNYRTHYKCNTIRNTLEYYYANCSSKNSTLPKSAEEHLFCNECSVMKNEKKYSTIEKLNEKYKK